MRPDDLDASRLYDMLAYAREIVETLTGVAFVVYLKDKNLRLATERRIEIIGQAAHAVSRAFQDAHPEIPWRVVIAQRNVLAHEYGEIKDEIIFRNATTHVPRLIEMLRPLVPPEPPEDTA